MKLECRLDNKEIENLKQGYLCNEKYFNREEALKKEKIISYRKNYENREKYIKSLIDEKRFENMNNKGILAIGLSISVMALALIIRGNIHLVGIFLGIGIIAAYVFRGIKVSKKRELETAIGNQQEMFDRTITLEKDKYCISIESQFENEKFNIADFLGVYTNMVIFRDKDTFKAFEIKKTTNSSIEEDVIISFLEENKYDNEKNRAVFKMVKTKLKLKYAILFSAIAYVILCISVAVSSVMSMF